MIVAARGDSTDLVYFSSPPPCRVTAQDSPARVRSFAGLRQDEDDRLA